MARVSLPQKRVVQNLRDLGCRATLAPGAVTSSRRSAPILPPAPGQRRQSPDDQSDDQAENGAAVEHGTLPLRRLSGSSQHSAKCRGSGSVSFDPAGQESRLPPTTTDDELPRSSSWWEAFRLPPRSQP